MQNMFVFIFTCLCLLAGASESRASRTEAYSPAIGMASVLNGLSNKDVQSVYQDRDGYIWISTRNGLFQYDGYSIVSYKSNYAHPDLLTSNNILCVAEDTNHRLWIGTYGGLNVLDKQTGIIRKINHPEMNGNSIPKILVTRKGRIFFATDWGLYEYQEETDDFLVYDWERTGKVLPKTTIKALCEDDRGDIWIGTWDWGLFRYETSTGKFVRYPRLNARNSAHVIFQDSRKNMWIGSWHGGLTLLQNAWQMDKLTWVTYRNDGADASSISDNIIYALSEDVNSGALWIGTRKGLSVLPPSDRYTGKESFENYYPDDSESAIASDEVTSVVCDRQGLMWLGMIGGGVTKVNTRKADFVWDDLRDARQLLKTTSVRSIFIDDEDKLWLGTGSYGFGVRNRNTGEFVHYSQMPEFAGYRNVTTVMSIMQYSVDGHIWIAAYDGGVYEIDKQAPVAQRVKHYLSAHSAWLAGDCVYYVYEDKEHNLWFATRNGVSVRTVEGKAVRFDSLQVGGSSMRSVVALGLTEGNGDDVWVASGTHGVLLFRKADKKSGFSGYSVAQYAIENGKLNSDYVDCVFKDRFGRIWIGGGNGLGLYDKESDSFLPFHANWNLPGDVVVSIKEDSYGHLWLGTNAGLVKLTVPENLSDVTFRLYTTANGLQDNIFIRGAASVARDGEMFFGGHRGYNSFYPERLKDQAFSSPVVVTDIKIFNQTWHSLPEDERNRISAFAPGFTDEIRLDYLHNNFSIEFSALEYANPARNRYAYKLQDFESEWQYTDASKRFAYYNNLHPGTYTFFLKASNSNDVWDGETLKMKIVVLPPPWKTWWAYTIYTVLVISVAYYFYYQVRNRIRLRNALQLREMEKAKAEEVNHAKLQFFTNITHELLTPLTILSASVDELKRISPVHKEQYRLMNNNINRLIRLLQQILEFRKAETGNLKLKVSQADLSLFVRRSVESFKPLMRSKDLRFSISCNPESLCVYFDMDKVDKILYNLLSNASKYNRPGGMVSIELAGGEDGMVRLVVKDNGPGITEDVKKGLFKRFYEGDYRRFKTIGTGIGLSLVHDLVELHHGSIQVESEKGEGTAFIVSLPVSRSAYAEEEIDDTLSEVADEEKVVVGEEADESPEPMAADESAENEKKEPSGARKTLLLVEDNEDLLKLMVKLLGVDYALFTASNGKEALEVVNQQEVDLIVSDVMMPEMDGIELCRCIKNQFETSHIPVILLTAKNKEEDRVEAYESGADAFISKPFSLSVLHARISNLLRKRERMGRDFKKQLVFEAKELNITTLDEDFLQRAIDCVNNHISDPDFGQAQLLNEMHTSKSTFFRKLKSLTGLSGSAFIFNIRMKAACRIMEEKKRISVSELAYAVGYSDPRYFSACFKKEFGMRPSDYMKKFTTVGNVNEEMQPD